MKAFFENFKNKYFAKDLDFRARLFYILALSGAAVSFITAINGLIDSMIYVSLVSIILFVLSLGIMIYAQRSGNYRRCYYITIIVVFLMLFSALFFVSGGYHSGMPAIFIFAILFTMLMLDGWQAFMMMGIEIVVYFLISLIAYLHPELVIDFKTEFDLFKDIQFGFITVGVSCGLVVFLHLREYESQRRQLDKKNKELEQRNEAKSAFLNTVAHEIKNPLNIISLHAQDSSEILEEEPMDKAQILENQKIIGNTVIRIDRILTDLMDTVSIEEGRLSLSIETMKLSDVIKEAVKPWQKQYDSGKLETKIVLQLSENAEEILADYDRLYQVMENLLSNAFRHTKKGVITISLDTDKGMQRVCVSDDGEGMDDYMRENALKGYVSANKDYWRHGIGLYVCDRVIEAHGGKIWIESEKGKGTSIFFTLPTKEAV